MGTIRTLQVFTQVYNIAGAEGGPSEIHGQSIVTEIYHTAFRQYKIGLASAITVILFIVIMILTLIQMKVFEQRKQIKERRGIFHAFQEKCRE